MNYKDALRAMLDGKCVRHRNFHEGVHMRFSHEEANFLLFDAGGALGGQYPSFKQRESDQWELYEPPPSKMTLVEAAAEVQRRGGGSIRRRGNTAEHSRWLFPPVHAQADDWEVLP